MRRLVGGDSRDRKGQTTSDFGSNCEIEPQTVRRLVLGTPGTEFAPGGKRHPISVQIAKLSPKPCVVWFWGLQGPNLPQGANDVRFGSYCEIELQIVRRLVMGTAYSQFWDFSHLRLFLPPHKLPDRTVQNT